jgi:hypothetical protein
MQRDSWTFLRLAPPWSSGAEGGSVKTPLGTVGFTNRAFEIILFQDRYGTPCSLQQSSLADFEQPGSSAVWLGVDQQLSGHDGIFDPANQTRMHLDLAQVKALICVLEQWLTNGHFTDPQNSEPLGRGYSSAPPTASRES